MPLPQWETQIGWGAPKLPVKKKPTPKPELPDLSPMDVIASIYSTPYDSELDARIAELSGMIDKGADYSQVPSWSQQDIGKFAAEYAQNQADLAAQPYKQLQKDVKELYAFSGEMAGNFGKAVASFFSGGAVTEAAAQQHATETYGSKYAIAAAVDAIGTKLMNQISGGLTERQLALAEKVADIYAQRPDLEREARDYLVDTVKNAREAADVSFQDRVQMMGVLINTLKEARASMVEENEKKWALANPETDEPAAQNLRWIKQGNDSVGVNPVTGKEVIRYKGFANSKAAQYISPSQLTSLQQLVSKEYWATLAAWQNGEVEKKPTNKQAQAALYTELLKRGVPEKQAASIAKGFAPLISARPQPDGEGDKYGPLWVKNGIIYQTNKTTGEVKQKGTLPKPTNAAAPQTKEVTVDGRTITFQWDPKKGAWVKAPGLPVGTKSSGTSSATGSKSTPEDWPVYNDKNKTIKPKFEDQLIKEAELHLQNGNSVASVRAILLQRYQGRMQRAGWPRSRFSPYLWQLVMGVKAGAARVRPGSAPEEEQE